MPWIKKGTCPQRLCGTMKIHFESQWLQIGETQKIGTIGKTAICGNSERKSSMSSLMARLNMKFSTWASILTFYNGNSANISILRSDVIAFLFLRYPSTRDARFTPGQLEVSPAFLFPPGVESRYPQYTCISGKGVLLASYRNREQI